MAKGQFVLISINLW